MKRVLMLLIFILSVIPLSSAFAYTGEDIFPLMVKDPINTTAKTEFLTGKEKIVYNISSAKYVVTQIDINTPSGGYEAPAKTVNTVEAYAYDISNKKYDLGVLIAGKTLSVNVTIPNFSRIEIVGFDTPLQYLRIGVIKIYALDSTSIPTPTPTPTPTPIPTPTPTPTPTPDTTPPVKPIGLSGKGADKQAVLTWTANTEPDLAAYNVYQDGTKIKSVTTAGTTVDSLKNGKTYSFAVTAVDKSGNESIKSSAVNVTPNDKIDVNPIPNMDSIILQISGGTSPYTVDWGTDTDSVDVSQYTITGLTANHDYSITITDASGLKWTGTINTGDKKGYVPPTMPNANTLFQKMLDVFGSAGTIGLAIATAAVSLGVLIVLGFWGFRVAKRWLSKAK